MDGHTARPINGSHDVPPPLERDEILARAMELTLAEGLPAVTVERLALDLEVAPEQVRTHFAPDDRLILDAFYAVVTMDLEEARAHTAAAPTPLDAAMALMDFNVDSEATAVWMDAWSLSRRVPELATGVREFNNQWLQLIASIIQAGCEIGQFNIDDVDIAAQRMLTLIDGLDSQKMCRAVPKDELKQTARAYVNSMRHSVVEQTKRAALGILTAGAAHEMKNPLNFVLNFTELNLELCTELREEYPEESHETIADVETNLNLVLHHAKRALGVMDTMLQVGRARTNEDASVCRVNQIVEQSVGLAYHSWRAAAGSARCDVDMALDDDDPAVLGFEGDLVQVIINLVMNGLDAASSHDERNGLVRITVRHDEASVVIDVSDNGPGIEPQHLPRVFEPFFTTKQSSGGTGLGLSICKDIIDHRHKGDLSVTSTPGSGAQFHVRLPLHHTDEH